MKELITTQLIEEYQKEVDFYEKHIKAKTLSESTLALYGYKKSLLNEVITSLQSKQSEERQNIVDAEEKAKLIDYSKVTRVEVINHNPSIKREMGRVFSSQDSSNKVFVSLQDEERTLKIFIEKR
jgi:lysyl-tRNA synthetase class II